MVSTLVDADQTKFLKGRSISKNCVDVTKLIQSHFKRKKMTTLVLKSDFAKSFLIVLARTFYFLSSAHGASLINGAIGLNNRKKL